jgi:hypothetical protein
VNTTLFKIYKDMEKPIRVDEIEGLWTYLSTVNKQKNISK